MCSTYLQLEIIIKTIVKAENATTLLSSQKFGAFFLPISEEDQRKTSHVQYILTWNYHYIPEEFYQKTVMQLLVINVRNLK